MFRIMLIGVFFTGWLMAQSSFGENTNLMYINRREVALNSRIMSQHMHTVFYSQKRDSSQVTESKVFRTALTGSFLFGIMGFIIGYHSDSYYTGSPDVFLIKVGSEEGARRGASIGASTGNFLGFLAQRKHLSQKHALLRVVVGSALGGLVGYALFDRTYGISSIVFPPVVSIILLKL